MMKKNGFTLAELLGVIVILAIIVIVSFPPIVNEIRKMKGQLSSATSKLIYSATEIYVDNNQNTYPIYNGNNYCITLQTLVTSGDLKEPVKDVSSGQTISLDKVVKVNITNPANIEYTIVDSADCVIINNAPIINADNSGASAPMLSDNMIPIKWNGVTWVKADKRNPTGENRWYNYDKQEWANVALVTASSRVANVNKAIGEEIPENEVLAYLVWIPRYKYKLFNLQVSKIPAEMIDVVFESKTAAKSAGTFNGDYLTHPAFTFGTKEVSGLWVGKFETTGDATIPTIKPNSIALTTQNASIQFATAKKFNNGLTYGLSTTNDPHMLKSIEWGAVAYLSQSTYGKYGNSTYTDVPNLEKEIYINHINSDIGGLGTITGCAGDSISSEMLISSTCPILNKYTTAQGVKASTTGNEYGIYDMSGGSLERVMGAMYNDGAATIQVANSGFTQVAIDDPTMVKYIDKYTYGATENDDDAFDRKILGDATSETRNWNADDSYMVYPSYSWFTRGGSYKYIEGTVGIFAFNYDEGDAVGGIGFRVTLLGE